MSPYSKKKEVIFLIRSPLSQRDFARFDIKNWVDRGWETKIFDITKFLDPKYWEKMNGDKLSVNFEGLIIFQNINDIIHYLNNLQNKVVFIDHFEHSSIEMKLRKIAQKHGVLVEFRLGTIPQYSEENHKINYLKLLSFIINPIKANYFLVNYIKNKFKKIRVKKYFPDYVVVSGTKSMLGINEKKTLVIKAHNFDYDIFIRENQIKLKRDINYLVFLDEYGPYHDDYMRAGTLPWVSAKNYYPVIDSGLQEIAKALKLNIKIAAHPRSNYENIQLKYKHQIIKNKTFELIKGADLVIAHHSTAVQMAVLLKKPIIFVTTDEIENKFFSIDYLKSINLFAKKLGKKVINLSQPSNVNNWEEHLKVDKVKYQDYIQKYIKIKGTPEKLASNIVIEYFENNLL